MAAGPQIEQRAQEILSELRLRSADRLAEINQINLTKAVPVKDYAVGTKVRRRNGNTCIIREFSPLGITHFDNGYPVFTDTGRINRAGDAPEDIVAICAPPENQVAPAPAEEPIIPITLEEVQCIPDLEADASTKVANLAVQALYRITEARIQLLKIAEAKSFEEAQIVQLGLIRELSKELELED